MKAIKKEFICYTTTEFVDNQSNFMAEISGIECMIGCIRREQTIGKNGKPLRGYWQYEAYIFEENKLTKLGGSINKFHHLRKDMMNYILARIGG